MDIYGYPSYQYNQSDELAKQMFAHQALAAADQYPNTNRELPPGVQEIHALPAPTGAPWNVHGLPWSLQSPPNLVHFTAQTDKPILHCKRKSTDLDPVIPAKQLITEEKMAAHFNSLHISSDYTQHSLASEDVMELAVDTASICERLKGHKIVISEDIKNIKDEPLLPATLIEKLQKPQMSLVVWKPREEIIKVKTDEEESDEISKRKNGVLVPQEYSGMDVEM